MSPEQLPVAAVVRWVLIRKVRETAIMVNSLLKARENVLALYWKISSFES